MPRKNEPPPPLPGDIVQVTDQSSPLFTALLVVQEVHLRFVGCGFPARGEDATLGLEYARMRPKQIQRVGTAMLVPAEVAKARELAIKTAALLARENKQGGTDAKR